MKKIVIIAESGSDITVELAKKYDITVVPMHVQFDEETHVYVTFVSGPMYVALPGINEEVRVTYMTTCSHGGRMMW